MNFFQDKTTPLYFNFKQINEPEIYQTKKIEIPKKNIPYEEFNEYHNIGKNIKNLFEESYQFTGDKFNHKFDVLIKSNKNIVEKEKKLNFLISLLFLH